MRTQVIIEQKKLTLPELNHVHNLILSSYWGAYLSNFQTLCHAFDNSDCFLIYNEAKEIIGFIRVVTDKTTFAYPMDFIIVNEYRSKGIGSFVLDTLINSSEYEGVSWLIKSTQAMPFYIKNGFIKINAEVYAYFKK